MFDIKQGFMIMIIGLFVWFIGYAMSTEPRLSKLGGIIRVGGMLVAAIGLLILLIALVLSL